MLRKLRKSLPPPIRNAMRRRGEARILSKLPRTTLDTRHLRRSAPTLDVSNWEIVAAQAQLIEHKAGAVNPGDRRAIYSLTRALGAKQVLEIGTNIGGSTVMFALALHGTPDAKLTTVDICDCNGPNSPAVNYGVPTPIEGLRQIGCEALVEFVTADSVVYLRDSRERYDLIFLDGRHDAEQVYREIPLALRLLTSNGLILLHDYFPNLEPLWNNRHVIPGPYLAVERFRREGADVRAVPLGALPWPTKRDSNVTSLAYLIRS